MTALDVGVNNLVACTTEIGQQFLYSGTDSYEQFRETTMRIAELQSKLPAEKYSSEQIRRLYRKRTRRRDHAMCALARDLFERLAELGVSVVYVGDLTGVLETHWSVEANAKTHNFWAHRRFIDRLKDTAEEYGITVEERDEAWTSQECPECGEREKTIRHGDSLWCPCGFEAHADLDASRLFLETETGTEVGPMGVARLRLAASRGSLGDSGLCGSSGTTTNGRSNHTLTTVPKNHARTCKLLPLVVEPIDPKREESRPFARNRRFLADQPSFARLL